METLTLKTIASGENGTFGTLLKGGVPFCVTLERPWVNNIPLLSCIPAGKYICKKVNSRKFGDKDDSTVDTFEVTGVLNRSHILFHKGNTIVDTHGCILLGISFNWHKPGIVSSGIAFENFNHEYKSDFLLEVIR